MSPISVALDMTFPNRNQGGTGVYARSLLTALRERDDVVPWVIAGPKRSNVGLTLRWLIRGARAAIESRMPEVLHCPSFVAPWAIRVPMVVTVHDSAGSRFPNDHPFEWRLYVRALMPRRLRAATRVITVSNFARAEIIDVYGVDPARVAVVPEGLDQMFAARQNDAAKPNEPVLLFPGAPLGRKNLDLVLRCMSDAPKPSALARSTLEITGASETDFPQYVRRIRALGLERRVLWRGRLDFAQMPAAYAAATAVVYPSVYEGFGFPPLEAMAAGTPVVASNRGSLPEVLDDAALLVDPADSRAWIDSLEAVLTNDTLRYELVDKGRRRARMYTWAACAAQTVEVYREAAAVPVVR